MTTKSKSDARKDRRNKKMRANKNTPLLEQVKMETEAYRKPVSGRKELAEAITNGQRKYDAAIKSSDIIFGVGPAGTGKTWLAVQRAAEALKAGHIEKIYLTRPNVEVGRGFGFLPGDLDEKYSAYILPLSEALEEAFGASHLEYLLKNKTIDQRPLAFMRGSTLKDGWVIADEMQNATPDEFKMFLSRIGKNAKLIINGDPLQVDQKINSGLEDAMRRVEHIERISVVKFGTDEIVRHGIVQEILQSYDEPLQTRYNDLSEDENKSGLNRMLNAGKSDQ